jgi:hypothetical protein
MDPIPSIQAMLAVFPAVTDASVREYLTVIESLLNMSDMSCRPVVADMLRTAAGAAKTDERRAMLVDAAAAIEATALNPVTPAVKWVDDPIPEHKSRAVERPVRKRTTMKTDEFRRLNTRTASILNVGGFRPTFDPTASNFGLTPLGFACEEWPTWESKPLLFVCQMNLSTAPAVPPLLEGIQLITFFVNQDINGLPQTNGNDWRLRTYTSLEGLVPLRAPDGAPTVKKGFECRWEASEDHPNHDDPDMIIPEGTRRPRAALGNVARTKIGGYVSTIQSEPWWDYSAHPSNPKYCLQGNSEEKVGMVWGDGGIIYLARGTAPGSHDEWFLDWQCF